eukprot:CAMPEP_0181217036 /NCGR_PEP_ID=MMETSP1096-20121128/26921_1 /TAXON_ID=156174 ORGANISM="Chrysochromulina ericina, Strain CCMP281" /NCGR_SAMPLE_ID=MMETSP1096 /ASSEMBLY_ACC=CAM_ASM_000453 /LENGTH=98 /DNA_ID=CAMNT_0023309109 /DNA_START=252 /DNA_END=549 /DNA_ORIENTATION=-
MILAAAAAVITTISVAMVMAIVVVVGMRFVLLMLFVLLLSECLLQRCLNLIVCKAAAALYTLNINFGRGFARSKVMTTSTSGHPTSLHASWFTMTDVS